MKILHLTLKKQWFDMILSGEKREEYREIKPYWERRLSRYKYASLGYSIDLKTGKCTRFASQDNFFQDFDAIRFTNGYAKNAPTFDIECKGIRIGTGNPEWGGTGKNVFILSLGQILPTGC